MLQMDGLLRQVGGRGPEKADEQRPDETLLGVNYGEKRRRPAPDGGAGRNPKAAVAAQPEDVRQSLEACALQYVVGGACSECGLLWRALER